MSSELFASLSDASQSNFENSVAVVWATALLDAGYLVYWHRTDALETPDGWYAGYRANQATYLVDGAVQARVQAARGLMAIVDRPSALPRAATRPTTEGRVGVQQEVPIPACCVEVGDVINGDAYEIGSRLRWRTRIVTLECMCRSAMEQVALSELLVQTFDDDSSLVIQDHDGGALAQAGTADVARMSVTSMMDPSGADAETFELLYQAQLQFVA